MIRLVTSFFFFVGAVASGFVAPAEDHHEHPAAAVHSDEGHHHGDPDDHHDSPSSPCHHHDSALPGCACGPTAFALTGVNSVGIDLDFLAEAVRAESRPRLPIFIKHLAHVPLA